MSQGDCINDYEIESDFLDLIISYREILKGRKYEWTGTGNTREVWRHPNDLGVIKIPINYIGEAANQTEVRLSQRMPYLSRCKKLNCFKGLYVIFMEYIYELKYDDAHKLYKEHRWIGDIDCQQVGYDRFGQLKAYDFA